jgi:hypothetical protein
VVTPVRLRRALTRSTLSGAGRVVEAVVFAEGRGAARPHSGALRHSVKAESGPHCAIRVGSNERPKSPLHYAIFSFPHRDVGARPRTAPTAICCAAEALNCSSDDRARAG